jgi:hypothetical protein
MRRSSGNIPEMFDGVKSDRSASTQSYSDLHRWKPMEVQRDGFRSRPSTRRPTFKGSSVPRYYSWNTCSPIAKRRGNTTRRGRARFRFTINRKDTIPTPSRVPPARVKHAKNPVAHIDDETPARRARNALKPASLVFIAAARPLKLVARDYRPARPSRPKRHGTLKLGIQFRRGTFVSMSYKRFGGREDTNRSKFFRKLERQF